MTHFDESFHPSFQATTKKVGPTTSSGPVAGRMDKCLPFGDDGPNIDDFTKDEFVRLLVLMEGELQARDEVVNQLKKERTKLLLADAKYGKLSMNDPFAALRRDSAISDESFDERQIGQMYESQVVQLDRLIAAQRKMQSKSKSLLAATEKRHLRALRELEEEKDRKSRYADQGDDVLALLEKERNKLTQQLELQMDDTRRWQEERDVIEKKLTGEKKRHEAIVLYLIRERKQMLLKIHELRLKTENAQPSPSMVADRELIEELKKEVAFLRGEREALKNTQKALKAENLSLKEVVKGQEADLLLLRKNLISSAKIVMEKPPTVLPQLSDDRALVVANRNAVAAPGGRQSNVAGPPTSSSSMSTTSRLSTSSSFPMEKSRLPRAPITTVMTSATTVPRSAPHASIAARMSTATPTNSPAKKTPMMGVSSGRRPQSAQQQQQQQQQMLPPPPPTTSASSSSSLNNEPEFEQLEAAIQSMNVSLSLPTSTAKRSSSLPRERAASQPRRTDAPPPYRPSGVSTGAESPTTSGIRSATAPSRIATPSSISAPSRPSTADSAAARKLSGTVKRNGILSKAFGK